MLKYLRENSRLSSAVYRRSVKMRARLGSPFARSNSAVSGEASRSAQIRSIVSGVYSSYRSRLTTPSRGNRSVSGGISSGQPNVTVVTGSTPSGRRSTSAIRSAL